MSNWTKYINPKIEPNDIMLLKAWATFGQNGPGRCKIKTHNGNLIVKVKGRMIDTFNTMWIEDTPKDAIVVPTSVFFDIDLIKDADMNSMYFNDLKEYLFSSKVKEMSSEDLVAWFNKKYNGFNVTKLSSVSKHWVSTIGDDYSKPVNVVDEVFLFYFETEADKIHFKLAYG